MKYLQDQFTFKLKSVALSSDELSNFGSSVTETDRL